MDPSVAASLISGGSSLLGGTIGSIFNVSSQSSANAANVRLARENRDFYYQQWLRENAYNDPSAQMARLQRAGLNPNLMYGQGAGGLPASASMSAVDPGRVMAPSVDPLLMAQIGNIMADTALKKSQAGNQDAQADLAKNQIKVGDSVVLRNSKLNEMSDVEIKKLTQETDYLASLTDKVNSDIMVNYAQVQNLTIQQQQRWIELHLQSASVQASIQKMAAETAFTQEQCKYVAVQAMAKVYNLRADTALKAAQEGLTNSQIEHCDNLIKNLVVQRGQMVWDWSQDMKYGDQERQLKLAQGVSSVLLDASNASGVVQGYFKSRVSRKIEDLSKPFE